MLWLMLCGNGMSLESQITQMNHQDLYLVAVKACGVVFLIGGLVLVFISLLRLPCSKHY